MNIVKPIGLIIMLCTFIFAAETKIDKSQVPQAVLSAFQREYPKAEITGLMKETKNGTTYYEIESKEGNKERTIIYTSDGTVYEKEEIIPESELPAAVSDSIKTHYSGKMVKKVEMVTKKGKKQYEIFFEDGTEAALRENGKRIHEQKEKSESD